MNISIYMQKKNILVTGANGQLGRCIQDSSASRQDAYSFFFTDIDTLDITNYNAVSDFVRENDISIIINAAAYTAVDKAEEEPDKAFLLNRDAVANLAAVSKNNNCFLIHISTDYVFDGWQPVPHAEYEEKNPQSVYGKSKSAGEDEVEKAGCKAVIIRTSWLYSEYGNNFVKTMLKLTKERDALNVVYDQIGAPTYAGDLAEAIFRLMERDAKEGTTEYFHFANEGVCSWFDFATSINRLAGNSCKILPILSSEYATKAKRPAYSVFDMKKTRSELGLEIPYWHDSLVRVIGKIEKN